MIDDSSGCQLSVPTMLLALILKIFTKNSWLVNVPIFSRLGQKKSVVYVNLFLLPFGLYCLKIAEQTFSLFNFVFLDRFCSFAQVFNTNKCQWKY